MASRLQDVIIRDTRANQPLATAVSAGTLYYVTDEGVTERSNGTAWQSFSDSGVVSPIVVSAGTLTGSRSSLVFSNSNGISFGMAGSTITASGGITNAISRVNFSAGTTSNNLSNVIFSNANNVSFGLNGSTITATATVATSLTAVNISAGTTSNNLSAFVFSNSHNVSFSLDGSTIVASASIATSLTAINVSAGTTSNNLSALTFANGSGVSFGINGSVITASVAAAIANINISAGTTSNNLTNLVFSNSNGISFGIDGSTITASGGGGGGGATFNNYYANFNGAINDARSAVYGSNLYFMLMPLPAVLSANYLQYLMSMQSLQNRTFGATSANTSWSAQQVVTFHNQLFTRGTGASSNSLFSLSNYTAGLTVRTQFSNGAVADNWTASFLLTAPSETGTIQFTLSYACTSNSYVINSGGAGAQFALAINGSRWVEVPFNTSLPAGNYYMAFGRSTTTTNNGGATGLSTTNFEFCMVGSSYTTAPNSKLGNNTAFISGVYGMGVFTTNSTQMSTDAINVTQLIATGAANAILVPFMVH